MQQVAVIFFDACDDYKRSVATYPALEDNNTFKGDAWKIFAIQQKHGLNKQYLQWLASGASYVADKCNKDAEHAMLKIDSAVAKKLNGVEVKSAELIKLNIGKDGFVEGAWKLDNGKVFSFESIYAGGYNIQCLHVRTLYNLR